MLKPDVLFGRFPIRVGIQHNDDFLYGRTLNVNGREGVRTNPLFVRTDL